MLTAIFILVIFLYFLTGWISYTIFGHQLIKAVYEGRAISILNRVIEGQSTLPLKHYYELGDSLFFIILILIPIFLTIFLIVVKSKFIITQSPGKKWLEDYTDTIDAIPNSHIGLWIAVMAGLSLYIELLIIRFHSSYFILFAYFKNISLLSCFLGLGIGYARGSRRPLATPLVLPFLALQIVFLYTLHFTPIKNFIQNPIPEQITFHLNYTKGFFHILIVYFFLILIFVFNALCFIPLGHLVSRLMMRKDKLTSYAWNLVGGLGGILIFSLVSFMWTPPSLWIVLAAIPLLISFRKNIICLFLSVLSLIIMLAFLAIPFRLNQFDVFSPYQMLTLLLSKNNYPVIQTNHSYYHQNMVDLSNKNVDKNIQLKKSADNYRIPYYFKPKPEHVLIVGSGAGNDVAAAIRNGAGKIDAVEIDPTILQFGKQLHPESPYQASNVNAIVSDARTFIRRTDKRYDVIIYGFLDSLSLLSGKSGGIRLESYVYTVEAFREARKRLKKDGIISLSFCVIKPELGRKLFLMLQKAFDGQSPIVYFHQFSSSNYTFLIGDGLKKRFPYQHPSFQEVTAEFDDNKIQANESTDDWPFFYMPVRKYPLSYAIIILTLLVAALFYVHHLIPVSRSGFSIPCFFLGAGFMLIETKAITELALIYGSTWIVVSVVIIFILIMAFLANLYVMRRGSSFFSRMYILLLISLIAGLGLTFINLSSSTPWLSRIIMPIALTLPIFFSGYLFSCELRKSTSVTVALSSNLLGAMLGGFLEYNSMYFGFRSLYFFAIIMYGVAFLHRRESRETDTGPFTKKTLCKKAFPLIRSR